MSWIVRSFLAVLLAVSLFGATVSEVSAGLAAEIAAASDPCCEGDCPDDQACGVACEMMARGGMTMLALVQVPGLFVTDEASAATLMLPDGVCCVSVSGSGNGWVKAFTRRLGTGRQ